MRYTYLLILFFWGGLCYAFAQTHTRNQYFNGILYTNISSANMYLDSADGFIFKYNQNKYWKINKLEYIDLNKFLKYSSKKTELLVKISDNEKIPIYVPKRNFVLKFDRYPTYGFKGPGTISWKGSIIYSSETADIGLPQNIDQLEGLESYANSKNELTVPPLSKKLYNSKIDILAHWYNDFGLQRTIMANNNKFGSEIWFNWSWNFDFTKDYDPSRHPILGWYKGDNIKVLDWICFWLREYGVKGVVLTNNFRTNDWDNPKSYSYWYFQLFTNVPNFKNLKYVPWLTSDGVKSAEEAKANDKDIIHNVIKKFPNIYLLPGVNGRYPVLYIWDMESFRGLYDNYVGKKKSIERLYELRDQVKLLGYDGIALFARNLKENSFDSSLLKKLEDDGIYLYSQDYSSTYNIGKKGNTYKNYVNKVKFPVDKRVILNVMTSAESSSIHPSNWELKNSNPNLFSQVLKKAINTTSASNKPPVVVIYNVSEWAEAGPSLIPSVKYKFGYLEAIRKNLK